MMKNCKNYSKVMFFYEKCRKNRIFKISWPVSTGEPFERERGSPLGTGQEIDKSHDLFLRFLEK